MGVSQNILANDLRRMANSGATQLPGRVSHDPTLLEEAAFRDRHGMSSAAFRARQEQWAREAFEQESTAGLDGDPPSCDVPAGLSAKRQAYAAFAAWLRGEEQALATLENRRRDLQALIDAPRATEGTLRAMVRRTADALLGRDSEESDSTAWAALERTRAEQQHRSEAARLALSDLEREIEIATLRVNRLKGREREYLNPVLCEAAEPIERLLARKKAEIAALEKLLRALHTNYGMAAVEPPRVEIHWSHSWDDIAKALAADPAADIGKLLPTIKF